MVVSRVPSNPQVGRPQVVFGRVRYFKKSGAYLYLPEKFVNSGFFPFNDGDILKLELDEAKISADETKIKLIASVPHWWELLDWSKMPEAFIKLPKEIQELIKENMPEHVREQLEKIANKQAESLKARAEVL